MLTKIDLGYRSRPQFVPFHQRAQRWACIVAHRRAGKTVACIMDLVDAALRCRKPNARFAYIAPHYNQAKDVAWTYLKQYTGPLPHVTTNESELRIDLPANGARLRLYGADNYDRMRGVYFDGVILDEYADMDPRAWSEVVRPALSDRKGWATFIGTPKGKNAFQEIWSQALKDDDWFTMMLRASETGLVDDEELADARKAMSPEQYEQEYECSFEAAIVGAYYGRDMSQAAKDGRIRSVPWEPSEPVYTAWDLGLDDATAIWFAQVIGSEIRLIDYYETNNTPLRDIPRVLMNEKPYTYAEHYLPHDVEIRELMSGVSRKSSLEQLGLLGEAQVGQGRPLALLGIGSQHPGRLADQETMGQAVHPVPVHVGQQVLGHVLLVEDGLAARHRAHHGGGHGPPVGGLAGHHGVAHGVVQARFGQVVGVEGLVHHRRVGAVLEGPHHRGGDVARARPHGDTQGGGRHGRDSRSTRSM